MKEKLNIGIFLNSHLIPSWEYQIVKAINESDHAKVVIVISDKNVPVDPVKSIKKPAQRLLQLLDRTDRFVSRSKVNYDLKKDISELLHNVPSLEVSGGKSDDLAQYQLDLILNFGSRNINTDFLKKVKYGILAYSLDNENIKRGFWEVVRNLNVTNSVLMISEPDTEKESVIFSSWESTCPFSININRNNVLWRNALFMPRAIEGIYNGGNHFLETQKANFKYEIPEARHLASSGTGIQYIFKFLSTLLRTIIRKLVYTDDFNWQLLIAINQQSGGRSDDFSNFMRISSPKDVFWADPFVVKENDCNYVFVEEYIYKKHKAHISVLKFDNKGALLSCDKIIERKYHMSYPFVFKLDDVYYMIPETGKNKAIELYKSTEFPLKWEFERNLMENLSAVDTTLFFFNNKWWLFTTIDQTGSISGNSTELFLFFTDNFFSGKWESHPLNPIVSDVRSARPAGKLFIEDGTIYRPSQDCSGRYGRAFNINKVTKLTETEYNETVHVKVEPAWDKMFAGTHTYNFDKDFTVIDVYSLRKRVSVW